MPDSPKEIQSDLAKQRDKTADAVKNDVNAPESEQAVTRDTTPSVERAGEKPTRPERPDA
jgi:hypothetical protein